MAAFLAGRLPFRGIVDTVAQVVDEHLATGRRGMTWVDGNNATLADVLAADAWARRRAGELLVERRREDRSA